MRSFISLAIASVLAGSAVAQSRSSFLEVDAISGITVDVSNAGLSFLVTAGATPTFTYQNQVYQISDIFGFWNLSDDDDLTSTISGFTGNFGPWSANSNNGGTGGIAGWRSNPNDGIVPGGSEMFTYDALSTSKVERYGFHVRLASGNFPGTTGNTGHITVVPEPASMVALVAGIGGLLARRRRK